MRLTVRALLRRAVPAVLVLATLAGCAHGDGHVAIAAGDAPSTQAPESSTSTVATAFPSSTTAVSHPPGTSDSTAPRRTTGPAPSTSTTGYDTTSVTGLTPGGVTTGPPRPLDVAAGQWRTFDAGPLSSRSEALGAWTGQELLVVGGLVGYATGTDGAAYDPDSGTWRMLATRPNADRVVRVGTWTGSELVVFGVSRDHLSGPAVTGAAYDPKTDRWRTIAALPSALSGPEVVLGKAVWDGHHVVLFNIAELPPSRPSVARIGLYDPAADHWTVLPDIDGPTAVGGMAVMGDQIAVLGLGRGTTAPEPRVYVFNPARGSWRASPIAPVEIPSYPHVTPVWTGHELIVAPSAVYPTVSAAAYDPTTDHWRKTDAPDPTIDGSPAEVLLGGRTVTGVNNPNGPVGLYDPHADRWAGTGPEPGTAATSGAVIVSSGTAVFVWGMQTEGGMAHPERPNVAWVWTPAT